MPFYPEQLSLLRKATRRIALPQQQRIFYTGSDPLVTYDSGRKGGPAETRFASSRAGHFGVLYSATKLVTCMVETLVRDTFDGQPESERTLHIDNIKARSVAYFNLPEKLRTLRLTKELCVALGLPKDILGGFDHENAKKFSTDLYEHTDTQAIIFESTLLSERCFAIYDRGLGGAMVDNITGLAAHAELGIALSSLRIIIDRTGTI